MKGRARLAPEARRTQLLELGIEHFSERSYEDFSMEELAALAGVSKGLVFHYFPSKRDFYMEALRAAVGQMLELVTAPAELPADQALRVALDAYLGYVEERAPAYRAVLRGGIGADPEVQAIADGFRDAVYELIVALGGWDAPPPAVRTAIRGWIGYVEAASLEWIDHRDLTRAELVDQLARALPVVVGAAAPSVNSV